MHTKPESPFYPTVDGKPPKVPQEKPQKKPTKDESVFHSGPHNPNKYDFVNYDEEDIRDNNSHQEGPGPGFFNPSASKNQFNDFNPFSPNQQQNHDKQLPPELYNVLGPNNQNLPPHVRLEQLLQHIQSQDSNQGGIHSQNIHVPYPGQQNGIYQFGGEHQPSGNGISGRPPPGPQHVQGPPPSG